MSNQFKDKLVKVMNEDVDDGVKLDMMIDVLEGEPIIHQIMATTRTVTDADWIERIIDKYILDVGVSNEA